MQARIRAEQIRASSAALRVAAKQLQAIPIAERAASIARAARMLLDVVSSPGDELRRALCHTTGLSEPVIEEGLRTTLGLFERDSLLALYESKRGDRGADLAVAVLAGNVFSAAARPLLLPLLCGAAVLVKASSSDDVLPHHLARALTAVDSSLGAACAAFTFAHGDAELDRALLQDADVVSVYGSDETVVACAARTPEGARLLAHGHGLGAIFIARDALRSEAAALDLAARAARDIAAYDQRGCLSPHAVLVQPGALVDARRLARLLADALQDVQRERPRGAIPAEAAAAQLQWRGVAAALGTLHHVTTSAVSYEGAAPIRPSPGYRNVAVHDCPDLTALVARLSPLGNHLKALGFAAPPALRPELTPLAPYVCEIGAMQTPPLHTPLDGLHPLEGLK